MTEKKCYKCLKPFGPGYEYLDSPSLKMYKKFKCEDCIRKEAKENSTKSKGGKQK
jgi:hypothetical protein